MSRKSISLRQCLKLNDSEEQEGFCWRLSGALHLRHLCVINTPYVFYTMKLYYRRSTLYIT